MIDAELERGSHLDEVEALMSQRPTTSIDDVLDWAEAHPESALHAKTLGADKDALAMEAIRFRVSQYLCVVAYRQTKKGPERQYYASYARRDGYTNLSKAAPHVALDVIEQACEDILNRLTIAEERHGHLEDIARLLKRQKGDWAALIRSRQRKPRKRRTPGAAAEVVG